MKNLFLVLLLIAFNFNLMAQEGKPNQEEQAAKKEQSRLDRESYRDVQETWVVQQSFVLEATQVYDKTGKVFQLDPSTNFVALEGDKANIELNFKNIADWNSIEKFNLKGKLENYRIESDKRNTPLFIKTLVQNSKSSHELSIWISTSGKGEVHIIDENGQLIKVLGNILSKE